MNWIRDPELEGMVLASGEAIRERLLAWRAPTEPERRMIGGTRPRCSTIHRCLRRQALEMEAAPREEILSLELTRILAAGTAAHRAIQEVIPGRHEIEVSSLALAGHCDSVVGDTAADWKTCSESIFRKLTKEPLPYHAAQVNWYAAQLNAPRCAVVYFRKIRAADHNGCFLDLGEGGVKAFSAATDTDLAAAVDHRAEIVTVSATTGALPGYPGPSSECRECPFIVECHKRMPDGVMRITATKLVGQTFRSDLGDLLERLEPGVSLDLVWEPENEFGSRLPDSPNLGAAVRVEYRGSHLGYLPDSGSGSPTAQFVARYLRDGGHAHAEVSELTGGTEEKPSRGITLRVILV